ncbi:lipocalin-like domain-containing protein [Caldimonas brevitalea]|uniref:lipocalin-like domain-containing protein n=1 Tax=Caldimonas brevitalea TaxID=413882 RepID=UPI003AA94742
MRRRDGLRALAGWVGLQWLPTAGATRRPVVLPNTPLRFPHDYGSHPEYRTEWWYVTGALKTASAARFGFQVTFFRSRVDAAAPARASRFAATQLILGHAALTDLGAGRLLHEQRSARAGFGLAEAAVGDTDVRLRDWVLRRRGPPGGSVYEARLDSPRFALDLQIRERQPLLLQGEAGYSRKGPLPEQSSYYYSQPQLAVQGRLRLARQTHEVQGQAWLDHEWSEEVMHPDADGWDWIGMNLDDGSALSAARMRRRDGSTLWAAGVWRDPTGERRSFAPDEVRFSPGRRWVSPATQASYPVEWQVETPVGRYTVRALLDAQELDSRATTGAIYWEGLSELLDARGQRVGQGYLEMTGYADRLRL